MKKIFLLIILSTCSFLSHGFHIVGGEIELIHVDGFTYDLNLIQYFDRAQTSNPNPEPTVFVTVFRKSDNTQVESFVLTLQGEVPVPYTNSECSIAELITGRVTFNLRVTLDPALYDQPEGYYVVWERCCRNAGIVNIINPLGTGMTYVLDFPAIILDGEPYVNSSPTILPPLSDYACVDQLYYTDFRGTDLDGDSLTYSITIPLNSSSNAPVPIPSDRSQHFNVALASGILPNDLIPGSPGLSITTQGFLTVKPKNPGLYVFSVLVREFRDGFEIGSVKRDFQMLVLDDCNPPDPPVAVVKLPGDPTLYDEDAFVRFTVAEEKCFDFLIGNIGPEENVSIRVVPVNFTGDVSDFSFTETKITSDSSVFRVCIPECPLKPDEPYIIDLIAADNACPLPQLDTVRLTIDVEPPPNAKPVFRGISTERISISTDENAVYTMNLGGDDADGDILNFTLIGQGFDPAAAGMTFTTTSGEFGVVDGVLEWDTDCSIFDFTKQDTFELVVLLEDMDICNVPGDTLFIDMEVKLPFNSDPEVTSTLTSDLISLDSDGELNFTGNVIDLDGDQLDFRLEGVGFNPEDFGVSFEDKSGPGSLSSDFKWDLICEDLDLTIKDSFKFHLIANDNDRCRTTNADTLSFEVNVTTRENSKPAFEEFEEQKLRVNETYRYNVTANDFDLSDLINIDFLPGFLPPALGFNFTPGQGNGTATAVIEWTPPCQLLNDNFGERDFNLFLLASDDSCPNPKFDTLEINLTVFNEEIDFEGFKPPNVFTPNGDGQNDIFSLSNHDQDGFNLPLDNCQEQFQYMTIVDRSGREIFRTEDREFTWDGRDSSAGVYFYFIKYTNTEFRGSVTLIN